MKVPLPHWHNARVLVVGDVMLDRYWHGGTSRISPEAPVPVVHIQDNEERVGGAGNVALNVASLGGTAAVLGVVGKDEAATALTGLLQRSGVHSLLVTADQYSTITKLRIISRQQQLIRLDFEEAFRKPPLTELLAMFRGHLSQYDVVVLSDYGKGVLADPQPLIRAARAQGKPVLVDPKTTDYSRYAGATLITPNFHEFTAVVGPCASDAEIVDKARSLVRQFELGALLVTRGEHGMTLVPAGGEALHLPAQAREVYDVTGAGDTVIATLAAALAAGLDLESATFLSNVAAGIVVGKLGTASVTVPELSRALRELREIRFGILPESELVAVVRDVQAHGEVVVMTNGCFDILHAGHVQYLEEARKLGDRLVVAVNDDASVRRLKGDSRPINNLADRMAVLAALGSVDWVTSFGEDTPERLYGEVLPNVLVKGGDYREDQIAGAAAVRAAGGQVVVLSFKDGCSTSQIIKRIREAKD